MWFSKELKINTNFQQTKFIVHEKATKNVTTWTKESDNKNFDQNINDLIKNNIKCVNNIIEIIKTGTN